MRAALAVCSALDEVGHPLRARRQEDRAVGDELRGGGSDFVEANKFFDEAGQLLETRGVHGHALLRMMRVPLTYRDAEGELAGQLETDGRRLAVTLDGHRFEGQAPDTLEPVAPDALPDRLRPMREGLCACRLEFALPLAVLVGARELAATLHVEVALAAPDGTAGGGPTLELIAGDRRARSSGRSGYFENELLELQRAWPDLHWKTCFGCGLSDYSPYGSPSFGGLMCFRDVKDAYRAVHTKRQLFQVIDRYTEEVQETHACPAWERRAPGAGYRG